MSLEHGAEPELAPAPAIVISHLRKTFQGSQKRLVVALDDITASIPSGIVAGLVGPDAAGKTTLMRVLAGLLEPTSGEVQVLGRRPGEGTAEEMAAVGYMPQRSGLYDDLSAIDNLSLHSALRGLEGEART